MYASISERIINRNKDLKFKEIHSYAKVFPDFVRIIKYRRPIVVENFATSSNGLANEEMTHERDWLEKSINRTKTKISDLVLCNNFTHFVTFTFDAKNPKVENEQNRHNFQKMSALLINWLKTEQQNHFRTHGVKFGYLIIPERHKNGAWHFHALFQDYRNPTADFYSSKNPYITVKEIKTAKRQKNRHYLMRYNLGRSEICPIRDQTKMANYIKKYITKELITEPNAKRFWASRNLKRPEIIENFVNEHTKIPEQFKTQNHDYHEIFEIPTDSGYFHFLRTIQSVELADRKTEFLRRRANS